MKLFILHLAIVLYYFVAWKGVLNIAALPTSSPKLKQIQLMKFRFLTNWNFALQTVLFFGYFFHDLLRLFVSPVFERSILKRSLDSVFYNLSAPLSIFVCAAFWSLFLCDREFVFPKEIDVIMPPWVNHVLHTIIVLLVVLQMYCNKQPSNLQQSFKAITTVILCYFGCLYITRYEIGAWVYPFLENLEEPWRIIALLGLFSVCLMCAVIFHLGNSLCCDDKTEMRSSQHEIVTNIKKRRE